MNDEFFRPTKINVVMHIIAYAAFITYTRDFPASVSTAMICDLVKRDFS
ncbi:hypothetical protein [Pseudoalteromonas sp. BMB]|nr:hypothetical protein [Pseudoalteromonas sp. BMB]